MPRAAAKPPKRRPQPAPTPQPETVDPIWLLKAGGATVALALVCAYIALCLLFYQGQWQIVLHPKRTTAAPASIGGAAYQLIHFGPDESAIPQLTGWWIPAAPGGRYAGTTLLFLPPGDGSLADSVGTLATLHALGINIFAFDYRGYGQSAKTHPSNQRMLHDADSAWLYLTASRAIAPGQIVPYGTGTGASLAAALAAAHPAIPALILDSPHADLLELARRDPRSGLIPIGLLFHEDFPLAAPLKRLHTPKLLLSSGPTPAAFRTAADPKITVELASPSAALYSQSITRFLDQYISPSPTQLVPSPAPGD